MGKEEKRRIDTLMGTALLDEQVRKRLVDDRDTTLLASFGLSSETQRWLCTVEARSLAELAQAIVARAQDDMFMISAHPSWA
jgi:hypothetical protein